ncbi:MAG TPA: Crp/Fnr family transcriptional regulator [Actinomycetota bacterium]|nr:Crp/Fnr family transcriptional regulator [Actinomycetota bacterium]
MHPSRHPPSPLLDALDRRDRQALLTRGVARRLRRGQPLFMTGDRAGRAHVVRRGIIKLVARSADGQTTILGLALAGDVVGELAAIDGLPQPLDAVAATPCEVLGLPGEDLVRALVSHPQAARQLARQLARRNRWLVESATERATSAVPARLASRLLDLAGVIGRVREGGVELDLPLGQDDLGRLAGTSRESACKTLREWQRAGLLAYRGRRLRITRPDALERIRCDAPARAQSSAPRAR